MTPYFLLGYPRSRLAWLANALTWGPSVCLFEATLGGVSVEDLAARLSLTAAPFAGNSDCANALILDRILERWPDARLVAITRDTDAVASSLRRLGVEPNPKFMDATRSGLIKAKLHDALVVPFEDLNEPRIGEVIWRHCVGDDYFDRRRWKMLTELNVQVIPEIELKKPRCRFPEVLALHGES